jgi:hypothetical protein
MFLRTIAAFSFACFLAAVPALADAPAALQLPPQPTVRPAGIPAGAVLVSRCVPTLGDHWADPKTLPTGPIYGVWQGKPYFTEMMVSVKDLVKGFNHQNVRALPGYTIDHVDFEFEPNGHSGFPVPHYDLHAYYISPAAVALIARTACRNGE